MEKSNSFIPIVVVAYNRPHSLSRILKSLSQAEYCHNDIDLIISIDRSDKNHDVLEIANEFKWQFGEKIVKYQKFNLGLRKHIIKCGDLSLEYGAVIILEDDLYVSPNFYNYALNALQFSSGKDYIGGISLYNHQLNVHTRDQFAALEDGYDNWYFQFASSWGQAWTKKQWIDFKNWYSEGEKPITDKRIPKNVISWSNKSWLKYFIAFLIEKNKYFLYPKNSLTTNFSDAGTHVGDSSSSFQVPLFYSDSKVYNFSTMDSSNSVYDAFYENKNIHEYLGISKEEICIDLYGYKPQPSIRYWLTPKIINFKILKSYKRALKPIDANILCDIKGFDLFLYDTEINTQNKHEEQKNSRILYNIKHLSYRNISWLFLNQSLLKIKYLSKKMLEKIT